MTCPVNVGFHSKPTECVHPLISEWMPVSWRERGWLKIACHLTHIPLAHTHTHVHKRRPGNGGRSDGGSSVSICFPTQPYVGVSPPPVLPEMVQTVNPLCRALGEDGPNHFVWVEGRRRKELRGHQERNYPENKRTKTPACQQSSVAILACMWAAWGMFWCTCMFHSMSQ